MKRAIVKNMAETAAWRSRCQFITFITFLFTVNVIRQMAPLLSKVDLNKLCCIIQICAKFGKGLFNISKVIGRKTKWPRFFGLPGYANEAETVSVFYFSFISWCATGFRKTLTYLLTYLLTQGGRTLETVAAPSVSAFKGRLTNKGRLFHGLIRKTIFSPVRLRSHKARS